MTAKAKFWCQILSKIGKTQQYRQMCQWVRALQHTVKLSHVILFLINVIWNHAQRFKMFEIREFKTSNWQTILNQQRKTNNRISVPAETLVDRQHTPVHLENGRDGRTEDFLINDELMKSNSIDIKIREYTKASQLSLRNIKLIQRIDQVIRLEVRTVSQQFKLKPLHTSKNYNTIWCVKG